jgi:hypothetical protein
MIDWDLMDTATLEYALLGDMQRLIDKVRSGRTLRQEERDFIADRLEGKKLLKRGPKMKIQMLDFEVANALHWLENVEKETRWAALCDIVDIIGESERNVRNREKRAKNMATAQIPFSILADAVFNNMKANPFLFQMAKAAGATEAELNEYRPLLLRNKKPKK